MTLVYDKLVPFNVRRHAAYETLYILAVESALADANLVPVALKAISRTSPECPSKTLTQSPFLTSHNLHVPSIDPVAQYSPVN